MSLSRCYNLLRRYCLYFDLIEKRCPGNRRKQKKGNACVGIKPAKFTKLPPVKQTRGWLLINIRRALQNATEQATACAREEGLAWE